MTATLVWFRQDLRLRDNPALAAAHQRGAPIIPVYILDEMGEGRWPPGSASRWWLHHSLVALDTALRGRESRLVLARGDSGSALQALAAQTNADAVYWNRRYEPADIARDKVIKANLRAKGLEARSFNAALLHEPHTVANKSGQPFQVFTPFWRNCQTLPVEDPVMLPAGPLPSPVLWPLSLEVAELGLLSRDAGGAGWANAWRPGEADAVKQLKKFMLHAVRPYADVRDFPHIDGTSRLSPYLHFGEIGPRQIWAAVRAQSRDSGVFPASRGAHVFLTELGWREFAHHLLFHFPHTVEQPLRAGFSRFPWRQDAAWLKAWQEGLTGYPIVDAGMRELRSTGWMHNRVRMITASFLVKHLRIAWQEGAGWFWDALVDADLANNTLGWQWSAGCGADATPYFHIFNPVLQGEKFDADGVYVRCWIPELAALPNEFLHQPWMAPMELLIQAGIKMGESYPRPIVDHYEARSAALAALEVMRTGDPDGLGQLQ
ncbi:MAG: deoxyribodipyrimidine photo-lyase [Opitutaceae bacterium]|nr:deoxyribodipyrimidine photo-lyase [Opitutaceae bacterium]